MDIPQAIALHLRNTPAVTALLPNGANGIILAGTLMTGRVPEALTLPCIAVQNVGTMGSVNTLPLEQTLINLRVYDDGQPNMMTYLTVNRIIDECIRALHRVTVENDLSYRTLFEVYYDNYISPDSFDELLKFPFRLVRFRVYSSLHFYDPR